MDPNPYQAPTSAPAPKPALRADAPYALRSLAWISLVAFGFATFSAWFNTAVAVRSGVTGDLPPQLVQRVGLAIVDMNSITRLIGIIAFLIWVHRAAKNVNRLGRPLSESPAWCVLWFLIPIASLFMPIRVVSQISAASDADGPAKAPSAIFVWWVTYFAGAISSSVRNFASQRSPNDWSVFRHGLVLDVAACVFWTVSMVALGSFIHKVGRGQERLLVVAAAARR